MSLRFNDYFNYPAALMDGNACNASLTVFRISHDIHYTTSVQLKVIENQLLRNLTLLANRLKVSK